MLLFRLMMTKGDASMIQSKTFIMRLINDDPDGIKLCRVDGSSLVTLVIPRELLAEAKRLPEIPSRGVYYLLADNKGVLKRAYAGYTVQGLKRLDDHNHRKDWWNKAVMFLVPDSEFSVDVIRGLERTAIQYIQEHGSYEVDNENEPSPYVSPYHEVLIEELHDEILFRMNVLGFDLDAIWDNAPESTDGLLFHTTRRGVKGVGTYNAETGKFDVLPGSQIDMNMLPGTAKQPVVRLIELRESLLDAGDIEQIEAGSYVLRTTVSFDSPSAAAGFVLGASNNGWTEWVDESGRTLSGVYRKEQ